MFLFGKKTLSGICATALASVMITQSCGIISHADYYAYSDDYGSFLYALGKRESGNTYNIVNSYGYMGRWQLGMLALQDIGFADENENFTALANSFGVYDKETFLTSERGQDYAIYQYHRKTWSYIVRKGLDKYVGTVVQITEPTEVETTTINEDGEEELVTTIEDVVVEEIEVTVSNLLAGSHLMGSGNMQKYLEGDTSLADSTGTQITEYMRLFGGYDIENTIINGAPFDEICNCSENIYTGDYVVETADSTQSSIKVYSGHGVDNSILGSIENGNTITITKSDGLWGHINLTNGTEGYIFLPSLKTFEHVGKLGDLNLDGNVTALDILDMKKYIILKNTSYRLSSADLNKDGNINIADFLLLKKQILSNANSSMNIEY